MTRLESDLLHAIEAGRLAYDNATGGSEDWFITEAVREVAKKYIEKALHDSYCNGAADGSMAAKKQDYNNIGSNSSSQKWLKNNGVI